MKLCICAKHKSPIWCVLQKCSFVFRKTQKALDQRKTQVMYRYTCVCRFSCIDIHMYIYEALHVRKTKEPYVADIDFRKRAQSPYISGSFAGKQKKRALSVAGHVISEKGAFYFRTKSPVILHFRTQSPVILHTSVSFPTKSTVLPNEALYFRQKALYFRTKSPVILHTSVFFPNKSTVLPNEALYFRKRALYFRTRALYFRTKSHLFLQRSASCPNKSTVFPNEALFFRQRALHFRTRALYFRKRALCFRYRGQCFWKKSHNATNEIHDGPTSLIDLHFQQIHSPRTRTTPEIATEKDGCVCTSCLKTLYFHSISAYFNIVFAKPHTTHLDKTQQSKPHKSVSKKALNFITNSPICLQHFRKPIQRAFRRPSIRGTDRVSND